MKKHISIIGILIIWGVILCGIYDAPAYELVTQTIPLQAGWNSVFIKLDPVNNKCVDIFNSADVESVWAWNPNVISLHSKITPGALTADTKEWLVYYTDANLQSFNSLFIIRGDHPYLIKLKDNPGCVSNCSLTITGKPRIPEMNWRGSDSFPEENFTGFHIDEGGTPTFAAYFGPSAAQGNSNPTVYQLNSSGNWEAATDPIAPGVAYWVQSQSASDYTGPLKVEVEQGRGLDFGRYLIKQNLKVTNLLPSAVTFTLTKRSPTYDNDDDPTDGDVPMAWFNEGTGEWVAVPVTGVIASYENVAAGATKTISLGFNTGLATPGEKYASVLSVSNGVGSEILVPVTADYDNASTGLWVGNVVINKVSQPRNATDSTAPLATGSELSFRMILHIGTDKVRLLDQVVQMYKDETDGYVLLTDDNKISDYLNDINKKSARRISAPMFSFPDLAPTVAGGQPKAQHFIEMSGNLNVTAPPYTPLTCEITIGYNDPLNPFKHRFHPDHNNKDTDNDDIEDEIEMETFKIKRKITLEFNTADTQSNLGLTMNGWLATEIAGVYREEIVGLYRDHHAIYVDTDPETEDNPYGDMPIVTEGTFTLHRVSELDTINP